MSCQSPPPIYHMSRLRGKVHDQAKLGHVYPFRDWCHAFDFLRCCDPSPSHQTFGPTDGHPSGDTLPPGFPLADCSTRTLRFPCFFLSDCPTTWVVYMFKLASSTNVSGTPTVRSWHCYSQDDTGKLQSCAIVLVLITCHEVQSFDSKGRQRKDTHFRRV